jgi:hypothetical protein
MVTDSSLPYFIQAVLDEGPFQSTYQRWGEIGSPVQLRYDFALTAQYGVTNFRTFTEDQKSSVRAALDHFASLTGVSFEEVNTGEASEITYFQDDLASAGYSTAWGYTYTINTFYPEGGDVHISSTQFPVEDDFLPGDGAYWILLHETGHALGLKHPFSAPVLPVEESTFENTVMRYGSWYMGEAPTVLGMYDLAALHVLYGVNAAARAGSQTYSLTDRYIWDGSGIDTFNGASETLALNVNLSPGSWVWAGARSTSIQDSGQAFIGFGTSIENAWGGSYHDVLRGNVLKNWLVGNAGNDRMFGMNGHDTLQGGIGNDRLFGGNGHDSLLGESGNDFLDGGLGDDTLVGSGGVDTLVGGQGNDWLYVESVQDVVNEAESGGLDTIVSAWISLNLLDYPNIENASLEGARHLNLNGSDGGNVLSGNAGNNVIHALGSFDIVYAGAGHDIVDAGSGSDIVYGDAGNDDLRGAEGDDFLVGGLGRDTLAGGDGADSFVFLTRQEAGFGLRKDTIQDFVSGIDTVNLEGIDANELQAGNQSFAYIAGAAFGEIAGQLRYVRNAGVMAGDVNGDGVADFQIHLVGHPNLRSGDLVL